MTVHHIDKDVSVVPRGAFIKSPLGLVQINRSFDGLSEAEARKLDNFLHFREPKKGNKKSIDEIGDWSPAIDFLDVLSDDVPKGKAAVLSPPKSIYLQKKADLLQAVTRLKDNST